MPTGVEALTPENGMRRVDAPAADWTSKSSASLAAKPAFQGMVVIRGLLAAGTFRYIPARRILLSMLRLAPRIPLPIFRTLGTLPHLGIPNSSYGVRIRVFANDTELGTDEGILWLDEGMVRYEGLQTRFAVGRRDLFKILISEATDDPHMVVLKVMGHYLNLSVLQSNVGDHAELRRMFEDWRNHPSMVDSELYPPVVLQPKNRTYLLKRTMKRASLIYGILAGGFLVDAIMVGSGVSFENRVRLDALILVSMLHFFTATYRKVRREVEQAANEYRYFVPEPAVVVEEEKTAAELSVGVRLNSL